LLKNMCLKIKSVLCTLEIATLASGMKFFDK